MLHIVIHKNMLSAQRGAFDPKIFFCVKYLGHKQLGTLLRKRTHGSSAEAQWVKKTCPGGGQVSTGVWKPRQNPSEVGLRPRQSVSKGLERSIMTSSFLLGTLA